LAAGLIAFGALIVAGLALTSRGSDPVPALPVATEPVAIATTTGCASIASWLEVIAAYERQARWSLAASTVQTALRTPSLCQQDGAALAQKQVALSREALFENPPPIEDAAGQRRIAAAYGDLKALAREYGLASPPPLQIARSAYDNRLFILALAAYADAFSSGESSLEDREVVRADYAAQRNIGLVWSQRADSGQRQEGLARLATACRISEQTHLGTTEACDDLRTLLGPREKWPAPLPDPLIDTLILPSTERRF
jgi:hypothetical protein